VFSTGFSWAHFTDLNLTDFRLRIMNSTLVSKIQSDLLSDNKMMTSSIRIFESSSHTTRLPLENIQRRTVILRDVFVNQLDFLELDQYQLTAGKFDTFDGVHYVGVPRAMSVIISLNLMCQSPH
jgi:hypothetical protein